MRCRFCRYLNVAPGLWPNLSKSGPGISARIRGAVAAVVGFLTGAGIMIVVRFQMARGGHQGLEIGLCRQSSCLGADHLPEAGLASPIPMLTLLVPNQIDKD